MFRALGRPLVNVAPPWSRPFIRPILHRFEVVVDVSFCEMDYTLAHAVMTITHTGVPEAVGGRGLAVALARTAMETARAQRWKVVPACSYASVWVRRHPEYDDLRA